MNKKQYAVIGIFAAAFCAIAYLGWAFIVSPVKRDISEKRAELESAQAKLKEAQAKAAQHDKFQALAENIKRDLTFITQRVDPVFPPPDLYKILSTLGNRLSLPDYTYEDKPRAKTKDTGLAGMDEIPVKVKFKCGFHHLGYYLTAAISQDRLLVPDKMVLKANGVASQAAGKGPVDAELELKVFTESPKETGAK